MQQMPRNLHDPIWAVCTLNQMQHQIEVRQRIGIHGDAAIDLIFRPVNFDIGVALAQRVVAVPMDGYAPVSQRFRPGLNSGDQHPFAGHRLQEAGRLR